MSVKVGVRVRPFNQREVALNCKLCVDMIGPTTRLFDQNDHEKFRDFTFDYSFWSHDQFTPDDRGYFVPDGDKYADQRQVFEKVGLQILSNAWQGYHCCLFAYGQTGAGKSYSMVGYGTNKGIVPISCEEIFTRIAANNDPNKEYEVQLSMLQIYNERVQDLLIPIAKRPKEGHKIRQHKTMGIYVEGLSKHLVDTYDAIEQKMQEGSKNRSIAATEMNASSSRAHTIISIEFKQKELVEGKKRQKLSVIYLVDLAGSQKVGKTGATGDRLKEAAGINKSLSVLGLVISTLADKAMGKGKNIIVPYRDSCLTRILQNALGGNSKTLMICAISPANDNYEETLSTLRYADQAKKIQNKAVVNESQTDKLIRTLKTEKQELLEKVKKMEEMFQKFNMGQLDPSMFTNELKELNEAREQLRYNSEVMNDMTMTKKEKLKYEEQEFHSEVKFDKSKPHLSNLNEDPQLSRKINYEIDKERTKIGKRGVEPVNDIQIGGMGIRKNHAEITKEEDNFYVTPLDAGQNSDVYLNGNSLTEKVQIFHLDRLSIGANHMFIVMIPETASRQQIEERMIDWDYAQNELYLKKQTLEKEVMEQKEKKLKEENQALIRQKEQELAILQKKLQENEEARKKNIEQMEVDKIEMEKKIREEQAQKLRMQIQSQKKTLQDSQNQQKQKIKQKYYFEKKLLKTLPKCIELNLIAKQFKRNISMSVKMMLLDSEGEDGEIDMKKRSIKIKVVNRQVGYTYWWNVDKLSNRYYIIKDMSEQYFETGVIPTLDQKDDPFWDPPEHSLIGRGFLTTKALTYMFDNLVELPIIGEDDHCGELVVNLVPTDQTGQTNLCEEMDDEVQFEPEELLGKPFFFNLMVEEAKIPPNFESVFVEYALKVNEFNTDIFKTPSIQQKTQNPKFNYVKLHKFISVTEEILKYLTTAKLIFKVFGYERIPEEKKETKKEPTKKEESDIAKAKKQAQSKTQKPAQKNQTTGTTSAQPTVTKAHPKSTGPTNPQVPPSKNPTTDPSKKPNAGNTIPKRGKDDKDCLIY